MATSSRGKKYVQKQTKMLPKKKRRLKIGAILICLTFLILFGSIVFGILSPKITNIYISGNSYLSDQEIIEIAKLEDYPSSIGNLSIIIKKRLEQHDLIVSAKVKKKFAKVYIEVIENKPLFFDSNTSETVFSDDIRLKEKISSPILVNYVPDTIYNEFVDVMRRVNYDVLERTSEIIYNPNEVDEERFLFVMNDNNYVYLTLNKFTSINNYISIIKKFEGKKGILYLDSGEYFKVLDN
ncbi:MAG: FtsQ-type POTRA domain-containing protein [Firmicutes bacterium]|nr:FtsQ-type POTRA domain-containing protein [Bacillota bacterium]